MSFPPGPGSYILIIELERAQRIRIGALGERTFERGYYLYIGSALAGLRSRLERHLRAEKRLHWHIDYLLQHAVIREVWYAPGLERRECAWARALADLPSAAPFPSAFGASDCACRTHLFHCPQQPSFAAARDLLDDDLVRFLTA